MVSEKQTCEKCNLFLWKPDASVLTSLIIKIGIQTGKGNFSSLDLDCPSWRKISWRDVVVAKMLT